MALVTGAAQGIGRATALALADRGADLAVCDRDGDGLDTLAHELEAAGAKVVAGVLDVRHGPVVADHLAKVAETWGHLDVLVNNAGGGFYAPFLDVSAKGQDALVAENFTSVTNFVRGAVPLMTGGGSIINITSIEAHRAAPGFAIYSAMKAGVENLSKSLALELADRAITVNCVAPDAIPTPGDTELGARVHQAGGKHTTPLDIEGRPEDVAAAVVYLASPGARFVTGTVIHVDGGNDAARGWRRQADGHFLP